MYESIVSAAEIDAYSSQHQHQHQHHHHHNEIMLHTSCQILVEIPTSHQCGTDPSGTPSQSIVVPLSIPASQMPRNPRNGSQSRIPQHPHTMDIVLSTYVRAAAKADKKTNDHLHIIIAPATKRDCPSRELLTKILRCQEFQTFSP
jgi:hypothetical protein